MLLLIIAHRKGERDISSAGAVLKILGVPILSPFGIIWDCLLIERIFVDFVYFAHNTSCVGLLNLQPREHKGLQVGTGLPGGAL